MARFNIVEVKEKGIVLEQLSCKSLQNMKDKDGEQLLTFPTRMESVLRCSKIGTLVCRANFSVWWSATLVVSDSLSSKLFLLNKKFDSN